MSRAKPILGYPSISAAVLAMALAGKSKEEIAGAVGRPVKNVSVILSDLRSHGRLPKPGDDARVPMAPQTRARLGEEAARRGLSVEHLAAALLKTIARDGLTGAVLDDGEGR